MSAPWVVVGATGQQGGAVARALVGHGAAVRGLTRDTGSKAAAALRDADVEPVAADLDDDASVRAALEGAAGVFIMTTMTGEGGIEQEEHQAVAAGRAAKEAGLSRVVYSSVGGADRGTGIPHFESKWRAEQRLRAMGLPLTVIRPVFFMENMHGASLRVDDGRVVLRSALDPSTALQVVSVRDIGRMGALALLHPQRIPAGVIEFAGDELTPTAMAEAEGRARGLPARFEETPIDVLPTDDMRAMFRWFRTSPAYRADLVGTAEVLGGAEPYATWAARTA